jgi:hypothetical protein
MRAVSGLTGRALVAMIVAAGCAAPQMPAPAPAPHASAPPPAPAPQASALSYGMVTSRVERGTTTQAALLDL